jgi:dTDP-4-dehydrorhamnose reductase
MRILVVGAGGGLGRTFQAQGPKILTGVDWAFSDRKDLDVTNHSAVGFKLDFVKPDIVINCSGYTAIDKAEEERDLARLVNCDAVGNLAQQCAKRNIRLVTFSTDYVFAGDNPLPLKERDDALPVNVYGETKLAGEKKALEFPSSLVIRTSWLYSEHGKSFPKSILEKTIRGEDVKVVNDQFSCPTWSQDLLRATFKALEAELKGLFHFSCSGHTSWHELACQTVEYYNHFKKTELKMPVEITTADNVTKAKRPQYSILSCDRIRKRGIMCRPWRDSLRDYVDQLVRLGV